MADLGSGPLPLVGRAPELRRIRRFLDETVAGGSTLLMSGEPGVGKTALLSAAAELAADGGIRVIRAGGVEYETEVSFAGLHQLVDPLGPDLHRLPRPARASLESALGLGDGPVPDRLAVWSATLALFRLAASSRPLLVVVDDLHWLDRATGAVIGFVGRRLGGNPIGLLGAVRPGAGGFFERTGLTEVDVAPLPEPEAMDLLARRFAHLPIRVLRRVAADAQGNPLALLEFAASAGARQHGARPPQGSSREVRTLFQARVDRLPAPTRRLLLLAVLDGTGRLDVLAAASGAGLVELGPAERDHLVVVDERLGEVRFRHPMIRSAVVERSTLEERRAAHLRLAEATADRPERRGHHLAEATVAPDEDVAAAVEDGAHRTLRRGDVVGAVSKLLRAADLSPDRADRSRRLADAAYVGAHSAGRLDSASELLRTARRRDPTLGGTLHAAVATAYLLLNGDGDAATAHQVLSVAVESALDEHPRDRDGLSDALYTQVLLCHYAGRAEFWALFHRVVDRLGPAAPTGVRLLAETLADPVTASGWALAELDRSVERLADTDDMDLVIRTAIAGFYTDRLSGCREALLRVVRDGREGGAVGSAMMALSMSAFDDFGAGRWDAAWDAAAEAVALWEERGYRLYAWSGRYAMALVAGNRGDRAACRAVCDAMAEWAAPRQLGRLDDWADHALAEAALGAGDFEEAWARTTAITAPGALRSHCPQALWSVLDLVDAALHTGREDRARAHAGAARDAGLARLSSRFALVTAAATAMTAPDDAAPDLFRTALALPGAAAWPFELARTHLARGERLRRLGRMREARASLTAARDGFVRLGADPWARRAVAELAGTGATRRAARGGVAAPLTPQERRVAQLAATGLTNNEIAARLYLSPRTVSAHLYRAFPKLGIASRAALRDALNAASQSSD